MIIRRLNEKGIQEMTSFLDSLTTDTPKDYPQKILSNNDYSEPLNEDIEIESREFKNRFEVGEYFWEKLGNSRIDNLDTDKGLWAWISLFYFNDFCDRDSDGNLKPGEIARWIPATSDFRKYYRHLIAGPYRIWNLYQDDPTQAMVLLCKPHYRPGEVVEQLCSRQEWVTNKSIIRTANELYLNSDKTGHKTGAAGKKGGSSRRFSDILWQFDLTWDLYSLNAGKILGLLPKEFQKFKD